MNIKNRLLASLAVLIITFALDYLVYGNLLSDFFAGSCNKEMPDFVWLTTGLIIYAYMFCFIYSKIDWKGSRTQAGVRYGFWATLLMFVPFGVITYATTNCMTMNQVAVDLGYRLIATMLIGIVAAHLLKHPLSEFEPQPSGPVVKTDPD